MSPRHTDAASTIHQVKITNVTDTWSSFVRARFASWREQKDQYSKLHGEETYGQKSKLIKSSKCISFSPPSPLYRRWSFG